MTRDGINIEAVVAEVVRRLQRLADAPDQGTPPPRAAAPMGAGTHKPPVAGTQQPGDAGTKRPDASDGDLVIDARVVTLLEIERRLTNVRRVLVRRGAVVTPSVKDDLRKRHIRLEYLAEPVADRRLADELTIACCTHTPEAARAAAGLAHPAGASVMKFDDLRCAAQTVATILADANRLGVLVTDDPLSAVCLANRAAAARAAWVRDTAQVREAIAAIGLNLLVVHPAQCGPEIWNDMLAAYRQGLPRRAPSRLIAAPGQC
jgi:hypothetical protein